MTGGREIAGCFTLITLFVDEHRAWDMGRVLKGEGFRAKCFVSLMDRVSQNGYQKSSACTSSINNSERYRLDKS